MSFYICYILIISYRNNSSLAKTQDSRLVNSEIIRMKERSIGKKIISTLLVTVYPAAVNMVQVCRVRKTSSR